MERVVQFTGPRHVEIAEHARAALPPGHLRVRTRYSGISAGTELTAYRGTNPYLTRTWDPETRLFREGAAGIEYPVAGWGYPRSARSSRSPGTGRHARTAGHW